MPKEDGCNIFGGGPAMKVHWQRLWWDIKHLVWDFKNTNPYIDKKRKAYQDIQHAPVNVSVEYCRVCPYRAGHYLFWSNMAWIFIVVSGAIKHFFF